MKIRFGSFFIFVFCFLISACSRPASATKITPVFSLAASPTVTMMPAVEAAKTLEALPVISFPTATETPLPVPSSTPIVIISAPEPSVVKVISTTEITTPTIFLPTNYVVNSGDTLEKISIDFGVPIGMIAHQNHIKDIDSIFFGEILVIPNPSTFSFASGLEGHEIVVSLSMQTLFVYEDGIEVNRFLVSTGLPNTPTVEGEFRILNKFDSLHMTGPGYDLPDVPWTMFFYGGYAIHGAYWHDNFGHPMSHGCVNMRPDEAKWVYDFSEVGDRVVIVP